MFEQDLKVKKDGRTMDFFSYIYFSDFLNEYLATYF